MFQTLVLLVVLIVSVNGFMMKSPIMKKSFSLSMADIVDAASASKDFSTLVAALKAAKLVDTLKGPGPFTVFAPTDAAFAKLPKGTLDGLLKNIPALTSILTYHVVPGVQRPSRNGRTYETVNGKEISVKVTVDTAESYIWGGQENPAKVTNIGIPVSNGVIVVIDEVLIPYEGRDAPTHN